jgi:hypothetical protein
VIEDDPVEDAPVVVVLARRALKRCRVGIPRQPIERAREAAQDDQVAAGLGIVDPRHGEEVHARRADAARGAEAVEEAARRGQDLVPAGAEAGEAQAVEGRDQGRAQELVAPHREDGRRDAVGDLVGARFAQAARRVASVEALADAGGRGLVPGCQARHGLGDGSAASSARAGWAPGWRAFANACRISGVNTRASSITVSAWMSPMSPCVAPAAW